MTQDFDLVVLGGGNALALAIDAGKHGLRVALIEEGPLGGVCPNRGCIPSKLLLAHADVAQGVRESARFHVASELHAIDGDAILADVLDSTRKTDAGAERALPDRVTLIRGRGRFVGPREIEADGRTVRGERIVVATGSRPRRPNDPGVNDTPYWTSRDVFEQMDRLPKSIAIVGGGYIGAELSHFFHGAGVRTTLLHRHPELLNAEDEEIATAFTSAFTSRVPTRLSTTVTSVLHDGNAFAVSVDDAEGESESIEVEALLYAIGRVPNTDDIGIEAAGLARDARGFLKVDDHMRTNVEGVYALGDVAGKFMFTHSAAVEARYLTQVLLDGRKGPLDYGPMPHAVFTSPETAGVGATEQALRAAGTEYHVATLPYRKTPKGRAIKEEHGLCKILMAPDGTLLGCHIVGEQASVLIHEVVPIMKWRPHVTSLTDVIHVHPALSELVRNTARKAARLIGAY